MTRASCGKASVCWDLRRPAPVFCVRARVKWAVAPLGFEELWTIGGPVVLRVWLGAAGSQARGERDLGAKPTHFCDDFAPRRRFDGLEDTEGANSGSSTSRRCHSGGRVVLTTDPSNPSLSLGDRVAIRGRDPRWQRC